ncbi:WHG domain-containing protein [Saccharospirillum sp. HFRX-1]|uniref:TetR/AcrR family transcriptional regulator n=1 Tax=unclassified Saccharospirillum TaxID=2633430 RepID=UPI00371E75FB
MAGRAGLNVQKLIQAAAEMADELGFEQVTLSALARRFDVQVASLYSHLKNSEDLKTRLALLALDELAEQASEAVAGRSGKDALVAVANAYRDYGQTHPGRFIAARYPLSDVDAAGSSGVKLSRMLGAVLRAYGLSELEQTHAIRFVGSVFLGYTTLESAGGFAHTAVEAQTSWERTLDALDLTLRHWPGA